MIHELGHVCELVRYPIKSMAGVATESAMLGWHGLDGDRRFAFRRVGDASGFPFLTAGRLGAMLLYQPLGVDESSGEPLPTHVRMPSGETVELRSAALQNEISSRFGRDVELMHFRNGIFDDGTVSIISHATIAGICTEANVPLDRRRFRANIVLETGAIEPFLEDRWLGGTLTFGDTAAVRVTLRDVRCAMLNLDPDRGTQDPQMMKTVVRLNDNNAGVYGTVVQAGRIRVGDAVRLTLHAM
jgi:uncharacterized protein YcbX